MSTDEHKTSPHGRVTNEDLRDLAINNHNIIKRMYDDLTIQIAGHAVRIARLERRPEEQATQWARVGVIGIWALVVVGLAAFMVHR